MSVPIQQMTVDEFAESRIALGDRVKMLGAVYWVCTNRFFFRPLLPHEACPISGPDLPPIHIGGFQCVVSDPNEANSVMKFIMLDEVQDYELGKLRHDRRLLIKNAAKQFAVKPIRDRAQFKEQGFQVYSSFYERTRYRYKRERAKRENYEDWVDSVLKSPKTLILGGYDQREKLRAISLSYWVGHTLSYVTFFADTVALQKGVGELMFHGLRELVSQTPGIRQVFVRRYQGGNNMDKYYLMRGAKVVSKPCKLQLDRVSKWILKSCFPAGYAILGENVNGTNTSPHLLDDLS
jgi:hypothetical protein